MGTTIGESDDGDTTAPLVAKRRVEFEELNLGVEVKIADLERGICKYAKLARQTGFQCTVHHGIKRPGHKRVLVAVLNWPADSSACLAAFAPLAC
jgi:hypothetical protein